MARPEVKDFNSETGEVIVREMNDAEFAAHTAYQLGQTELQAQVQAKKDAKTSGIANAISLGFTQAQAEAMFP